jgi:hypothetical protein
MKYCCERCERPLEDWMDGSDKYTEEEIITAIYYVMNMETHNGVTKEKLVNAIKWLWYENYMFVPVPAQQRN